MKRRRDKRKNNVIIHGLKEPTATAADDRRKEDCDLAQEMLHKLSCDDVSINHITRLGPPSASRDAKPRPVKLDLMSTESRNRVLRNEKKLENISRQFVYKDIYSPGFDSERKGSSQDVGTGTQSPEAVRRAKPDYSEWQDSYQKDVRLLDTQSSHTLGNTNGIKCSLYI